MTLDQFIKTLENNAILISALLDQVDDKAIKWKVENGWSPLIIACHLLDEEVEDFRTRFKLTLETPDQPWPSIDPEGWVKSRQYEEQNYRAIVQSWKNERSESIQWLEKQSNIDWESTHDTVHFGKFSVARIAANWIAHDYLHIKQLVRVRYDYLIYSQKEDINYAGSWT